MTTSVPISKPKSSTMLRMVSERRARSWPVTSPKIASSYRLKAVASCQLGLSLWHSPVLTPNLDSFFDQLFDVVTNAGIDCFAVDARWIVQFHDVAEGRA